MEDAKSAFNDINFLNHLIALQPVKVIKWDGTFDGAIAHMRFWFFGWKDFIVEHNSNEEKRGSFSFKEVSRSETPLIIPSMAGSLINPTIKL